LTCADTIAQSDGIGFLAKINEELKHLKQNCRDNNLATSYNNVVFLLVMAWY
jgi:hypothetical protein